MIPTDAIIMIFKYMLETTGENKAKLSNDTSTLIFENKIYYKNHWLAFYKHKIETDDIYTNILFDYMKRVHRIWCCMDESGKVVWIKTCKVIENCVK